MALLTEIERQGDAGIKKGIDAAAISIILDLVQSSQYQYPIPSTVREVTSNGVDSVKEKNMAKSILTGEKTVEDYFVIREGGIYEGSKFDPSYYDLDYLSDNDTVSIALIENEGSRDMLAIRDYGVGLGGKRLESYFQIGYSSKRNLKSALGKFGIGAKAPLSLNSFFNMTSVYNGLCFEFLVYSDRVVSTVPAFDLMNNVQNQSVVFADGSVIYGKATTDKNNVLIEVETKRHQRTQIIDAVKTSLMYFKGVEFGIMNQYGLYTAVPIQADVIFEDEDILVTRDNRYSKPHLVLNGVNYGYLDFIELELEVKSGPIGIKMDPDEVDVTPSRESVLWSDKTRAAVLSKFASVQQIATRMISQQMEGETDYFRWSVTCAQVLGKSHSSGVLSALSGIVDTTQIKPVFPGPEGFEWDPRPGFQFAGWKPHKLVITGGANGLHKVKREPISWSAVDFDTLLYVQEAGDYSPSTDSFLFNTLWMDDTEATILVKPNRELTKSLHLFSEEDEAVEAREVLMEQTPGLLRYKELDVPEDYLDSLKEEEVVLEREEKEKGMSLAAIRKLKGKLTYRRAFRTANTLVYYNQEEIPISAIPDMKEGTVYGCTEDKPMLEMLFNALYNTRQNNEIDILLLSQDAFPYFATSKFTHVRQWFHRFDNGHLTTHPYLVGWNTCKMLKETTADGKLADLAFLNNFSAVDPQLASDYDTICSYMAINLSNRRVNDGYATQGFNEGMRELHPPYLDYDLSQFLKSLSEFQATSPLLDEEEKKVLSLKLFGNDKVTSAYGYDEVETNRLKSLLEQTTPYRVMVSSITQLTNRSVAVSQDLEMEIKNYIAFKQGQ